MKRMGKSIRDRLYSIAKDQDIKYQHLLIRFFHERLLYRLSVSRYCNNFYLKGGALLYAFNTGEKPRYTLDIDFSLHQMHYELETVARAMLEICEIKANDAVQFHGQSMATGLIRENNVYGGMRISIDATLDTIRQRLQIDVGYCEAENVNHNYISFPVLLEDFSKPSVLVYTAEYVIAEKFHAMIELSELNSRMKDFYDVHQLITAGKYDETLLKQAIATTFANRKTSYVQNHGLFRQEFAADSDRNRMWQAFLKKIGHSEELSFTRVMKNIVNVLQPIWLSLDKPDK